MLNFKLAPNGEMTNLECVITNILYTSLKAENLIHNNNIKYIYIAPKGSKPPF